MAEPVKIDIWSDIACPWCYIGKRRLEAGIAVYGGPVEVEYHSYELAPDTPVDFDGTEVDFLVRHKRMPEVQVRSLIERVTQVAEVEGLRYDFERVRHTNTMKAHQLLHYAKARGAQVEAKERLLRAYFVEGRHVGRTEDLAELAAEIGLDADDVRQSLDADEYLAAVLTDERTAMEYGISGVPFFVLDGRYGVAGAQRRETFADALARAAAAKEAA